LKIRLLLSIISISCVVLMPVIRKVLTCSLKSGGTSRSSPPADARVARGEARARDVLEDVVQLLALDERPQHHAERAEVHGLQADAQDVIGDSRQFVQDDANGRAPRRDLDPHHLLDRAGEADVVAQRRQVVHPVADGDRLVVRTRLADLLEPAVQEADLEVHMRDELAVDLHDRTQRAVGRRVLRPEVHDHALAAEVSLGLLLDLHRKSRGAVDSQVYLVYFGKLNRSPLPLSG
jgi:hypothetical protein